MPKNVIALLLLFALRSALAQNSEVYLSEYVCLNNLSNTNRSVMPELNNIIVAAADSLIILENYKSQKKSVFVYTNKQAQNNNTIYHLKYNTWQVSDIIFEFKSGNQLFMRFIPQAPNENFAIFGPLKKLEKK